MDEGYDIKIRTILFPRLQKYMYMMSDPVSDHPGHQTYTGFYKKHRINFTFFNAHKKMTNINNYKYPMLLVVDYPDNNIFNLELGEIDLCNEKNVNKAVDLIVKSLNLEPRIIHYEGGELMNTYLVKYFVGNSSSTTTEEEVSANSEYNAKELIIARYPNQEVHILNITKIN